MNEQINETTTEKLESKFYPKLTNKHLQNLHQLQIEPKTKLNKPFSIIDFSYHLLIISLHWRKRLLLLYIQRAIELPLLVRRLQPNDEYTRERVKKVVGHIINKTSVCGTEVPNTACQMNLDLMNKAGLCDLGIRKDSPLIVPCIFMLGTILPGFSS